MSQNVLHTVSGIARPMPCLLYEFDKAESRTAKTYVNIAIPSVADEYKRGTLPCGACLCDYRFSVVFSDFSSGFILSSSGISSELLMKISFFEKSVYGGSFS